MSNKKHRNTSRGKHESKQVQRPTTVRKPRGLDKKADYVRDRITDRCKTDSMIINIGASELVVADIDHLHTITEVEEVEVKLADGSTVKGRHRGKVLVNTVITILVLSTVYISFPHFN